MLFRRYGTFDGGIDLPDEKLATIDSPIVPARGIRRLLVPLWPAGRCRPAVEPGQRLAAGELLARGQGPDGLDVYAPLAGTVASLTACQVAGRDGLERRPAVELIDVGQVEAPSPLAQVFDWHAAGGEAIRERLCQGGLVVHRRPMQPLGRWVAEARSASCRLLIVNAMENQPCVTADHRLLAEHGPQVVRGLVILARAIEALDTALAVDHRFTDAYRGLVGPAKMYRVNRIALPHKYPTGADELLVKILTRRETPPGQSSLAVGAAVIDAATCFAAYRWVACGCPCTGRVVTVGGQRAGGKGNFYVPFGACCAELAAAADDDALIHGGPMVGLACGRGCAVSAATDAVLALEAAAKPAPGACIRCGWCTDHCPARLNVAALNDLFELGLVVRARRMGALACLECGVCSYVCPARLPLSQRVRRLKRAVAAATALSQRPA